MLTVRRATLADKPAIFDFIRIAYRGREEFKIPHRWEWQFENNPFREPDELPVWIALDGSRVVGQTCAQLEPIKFGNVQTRVGWSVDTVVLPEYRGRGIGYRLQEANQNSHEVFMSLSMSAGNRRIKQALGAVSLEPVKVFQLRLRVGADQIVGASATNSPASFASPEEGQKKGPSVRQMVCSASRSEPRLRQPFPAGLLAACGRLAARVYTATQALRWQRICKKSQLAADEFEWEAVDRFPEEVDQLWRGISARLSVAVERTSRVLNWKFCQQPHVAYRRILARRQGTVCGYVVYRQCAAPEPDYGIIVDLFADPDDASLLRGLVVLAADELVRGGVRAVKAAASCPHLQRCLSACGFREVRQLSPMCHVAGQTERRVQVSGLGSGARAFFGHGDHDLDQYPLTKV